ncbi:MULTISPECIES: flavin reductase family protein [Gracilibacillus]|uniref:flavin reductase family protein n=1 Tax=Gracilibacillus TaxID=74385 RepID=UPI000826E779|nr:MULTISPECIES: flavin reductase family protein [Gracilibacillus]
MSSQEFRQAMGKFSTGVTVVTGQINGHIHGMTVNAFMSVSLDPQLITISLDQKTKMYKHADELQRFGVSILREEQEDVSMIFAKQVDEPFEDFTTLDGVSVINNALTTLACTVINSVEAGDHMLLIAEVDEIDLRDGKPLIYYDRAYRKIID